MTDVLAWLAAHQPVTAGLVVSIVDFIFAVNPSAQSNSILHWILAQAHSLIGAIAPKPPVK